MKFNRMLSLFIAVLSLVIFAGNIWAFDVPKECLKSFNIDKTKTAVVIPKEWKSIQNISCEFLEKYRQEVYLNGLAQYNKNDDGIMLIENTLRRIDEIQKDIAEMQTEISEKRLSKKDYKHYIDSILFTYALVELVDICIKSPNIVCIIASLPFLWEIFNKDMFEIEAEIIKIQKNIHEYEKRLNIEKELIKQKKKKSDMYTRLKQANDEFTNLCHIIQKNCLAK